MSARLFHPPGRAARLATADRERLYLAHALANPVARARVRGIALRGDAADLDAVLLADELWYLHVDEGLGGRADDLGAPPTVVALADAVDATTARELGTVAFDALVHALGGRLARRSPGPEAWERELRRLGATG